MKSVTRPLVAFVLISFFLSLALAAQQTPPPSRPTPSAPQTQTSAEPAASGQEKNAQGQGQGTPPPASLQPTSDEDVHGTSGPEKVAGTSNDRLFFTLPNFLTLENGDHVAPLTTGQKFKVAFRSSFDYVQIPWYALLSRLNHRENLPTPPWSAAMAVSLIFLRGTTRPKIEDREVAPATPPTLPRRESFFYGLRFRSILSHLFS
jgi:hypothetical protein